MEDEIRGMRMDISKFTDWAKQSHELNQRNLSIINENFNLLLKLFVSQNGRAVTLENVQCTSMERENSERASTSPSVSYEAVNDFSDDEDVEESLRIKPISLNMLTLNNTKKSSIIKKRKSSFNEKPNSATDETLICTETNEKSTSETTINSKSDGSDENGRKGRAPKITITDKKVEQCLRELKRKRDDMCKNFPNALKLPDRYLEYGAARGWNIRQIKMKLYHERMIAKKKRKVKVTRRTCFKNRIVNKRRIYVGCGGTPKLNLTPEQLEANLKALREEHAKSKICPIPDSYFEFGAARGWNLRQVSIKYYCRHRSKCDQQLGN